MYCRLYPPRCTCPSLSKDARIILLTDKGKKEFAELFSEKDIKFVLYGRFLDLCMKNQWNRPIFSGFKYSTAFSAEVLNLTNARAMAADWPLHAFLSDMLGDMIDCAYWTRFFSWLANCASISIRQDPPRQQEANAPCGNAPWLEWRFDATSLPPAINGLVPAKAIVLNPYAKTIKCDLALFELIAERAAQMGYSVVCHVHGKQKGLKACASVECTLKEIGTFLSKGAALIALRSGFVDVMLHTGCKIVSLLHATASINWRLERSDAAALINPNVADVAINEGDYSATVDEVFLRLDGLRQKERRQ